MPLDTFHPIIRRWFAGRFAGPTEPQLQGWPEIAAGRHTLIAAPTGSGKTLAAFLAAIDRLLKLAIDGDLPDELRVVYISPLRALSNDMHRNLEVPLAEITTLALEEGLNVSPIRAGLRTGDTSPSKRAALLKRPPHILVTTPESLYLLLTSRKGRERLKTVETVIVDEIHALVRDKRGSHLALSLERLAHLCPHPIQRIGLSATQRPIEAIAAFLVGEPGESGKPKAEIRCHVADPAFRFPLSALDPVADPTPPCAIIDAGHQRDLDLAIEIPQSELGAVCMHEQWAEVNARLCELINAHKSTLIFVNTRRMAERVTHQLTQLLGEEAVGSHHGSLAAPLRLDTEQRLKTGQLKAVVATASLELGLDIGHIDLVVQIGSSRSIATFLQRVGRSGHALGLVPKGRLFALTRDELLESLAMIRAIRAGRLDAIAIPVAPLDILAQQIVAEVSSDEWSTDELFALCRRAYPYRNLARREFDRVIGFLSEGISHGSGRSKVYLHHDQVGRRVRARPGARIVAASNGGAIPEIASYRVVAEPDHTVVGTLDEDFASESQAGEIFLLGNTSWRILHVRGNDVTVVDAQGAPPSIPFWRGEAPGRTLELSEEVSRLREEIEPRLDDPAAAEQWLVDETGASLPAAQQIVEYTRAQRAAIGLLPSQKRIVYERFFDETGGMQLVVHAPFGARINKAWGLAMRKRFCRSFDFELQATADDDGFILSLGPQHSFPLESMFSMLNSQNVAALLQQALLYVPTFQTRWRWNVTRALLVERFRNGKKVPPALQRFRADDLLTAIFPKLTGCQENVTGDLEVPDHPLALQSMHDSLQEAHDLEGLQQVLARIDRGEIELLARDTREPSPFCYELLNANPYAFLDGGEIAERRTRAVATRRSLTVESVSDLGRLDPEAIARVRADAQPLVRTADELHDVLLSRLVVPAIEMDSADATPIPSLGAGFPPLSEDVPPLSKGGLGGVASHCYRAPNSESQPDWLPLYHQLATSRRATIVRRHDHPPLWAAAERLPAVLAAFPQAVAEPPLEIPEGVRRDWTSEEARVAMVRGLLEICGPVTSDSIAAQLGIAVNEADAALEALEGEGVVLRGRFTSRRAGGVSPLNDETYDEAGEEKAAQISPTETGGNSIPSDVRSMADPSAGPVSSAGLQGADAPRSPESIEWCHRRLLARIHRLTMEGLRKQIEPVTVDVFVRFLTRHHGLIRGSKRSGPSGLFETIAMLQGLDVSSIAWERDLFASRLENYRPEWLDELCLTGEVGWGRLYPTRRTPDRARPMASLTRALPLAIFLRNDLAWLQEASITADETTLSATARDVLELLRSQGAMFAADLMAATRLLPDQLNDVLGELVAQGVVTADGFAGLRALISARSRHSTPSLPAKLARRRAPLAGAGRWALWRRNTDAVNGESKSAEGSDHPPSTIHNPQSLPRPLTTAEHWAWQLLRRWGVVFRDLLEREPGAPRWFELLQVYRRLEARGEIRGGRFITGVAGEQFAVGDTVRQLRLLRDAGPARELVVISAADPLNLVGIVTAHDRIPSIGSHRIAYLDGIPIAALIAREVKYLVEPTAELRLLLQGGRVLYRQFSPDQTAASANEAPPADAPPKRRKPKLPQGSLFPRSVKY
ncbi:MAG: DEAD/DEAH box helicase [Planctomycetaceae bacterium]|nr:DEAD/DEAH box helicase [Planctomycetaceae bacterium]